MNALFDVPAPAKLNLFLHVTGRRADGYHLLQSVFMLIDWCDTLHFEKRSGGQISREDLTVKLPADDLIMRAARLLQQHTGSTAGAHISVEKRIPAQAGMGGGSSDAASTLLAGAPIAGATPSSDAVNEINDHYTKFGGEGSPLGAPTGEAVDVVRLADDAEALELDVLRRQRLGVVIGDA